MVLPFGLSSRTTRNRSSRFGHRNGRPGTETPNAGCADPVASRAQRLRGGPDSWKEDCRKMRQCRSAAAAKSATICVKIEIVDQIGFEPASSIFRTCPTRFLVPDLRAVTSTDPRFVSPSSHEPPLRHRYGYRLRKLTSADEASIRALAKTKSLRSLAADFGVSHETIRRIIRC